MAADSSWSLRGVDPRAREVAREAAKREGVTIGEWLNRQLLEEGEDPGGQAGGEHAGGFGDAEALASVLDRLSRRIEAAEHRSTLAITNIDQSVLGVISRLEGAQELQSDFVDRYSAAIEELRDTQKALHARIERMERTGGDASGLEGLKALEDALAKVAKQVYEGESDARSRLDALKMETERAAKRASERIDQVSRTLDERIADVARKVDSDLPGAVARQVEDAARKIGRDADATAKRLEGDVRAARDESARTRRDVEALINDRAEAGRSQIEAIETAVTDVNTRLVAAERDTDRAIKALERSFSELDARLRQSKTTEASDREALSSAIERRFEGLSREIADTVAATRADIAAQMVEVARQEGAKAVVAELGTLSQRLGVAETKQRDTLARISGEVAKLAGAVEARVRKSEAAAEARFASVQSALAAAEETPAAHAAEIERLHARLKTAETKSAAAVDAVARRVDAIDDRVGERTGEPGDELTRRIRDSEERTRSMINGALADINRRLDHSDDQIASALSPVQRALDAMRLRLEALETGQPVEGGAKGASSAPSRRALDYASEEDPLDFSEVDDSSGLDVELDAGELGFDAGGRARRDVSPRHASEGPDERAGDAHFVADVEDERAALETDDEFTLDVESLEPFDSKGTTSSAARPDVFEFEEDGDEQDDEASFDLVFGRTIEDDAEGAIGDAAGDDLDAPPAAEEAASGFDPFADDGPEKAPPTDFLHAAREAARQAAARPDKTDGRASPGFGPVEPPAARAKKGRSLLYAAGGLAFLAVGAAGVIVLKDSTGLGGAIDGPVADPLDGLFVAPDVGAGAGADAPLAAVAPRYVAAEDGLTERGVPVDLSGLSGADLSLYVDGDDLYAPVRPEDAAAGASLDAMLAGNAGPAAEPAAPAEAAFEPPLAEPASVEPSAAPAEAPEPVIPPVMTLEEAAAQGDPVAQYELGEARLDDGDLAGGAVLITQAADSGLPAASYRLGKLYENGRGVAQDLPRARRLLGDAAEAGHRNAMHSLGILYAEGRGGAQDFDQAARWFEEAALLGATDAQFNLAVLYEQGLGVPTSLPDAYAWFAIAGRAGDNDARGRADAVAPQLAPEARERADEAVRRFSPRPLDEAVNGLFRDTPWSASGAAVGSRMARVQAALASLGYDPGPADGVAGEQTLAAIRAYQTDAGMTPNGEADAALLEKLEAEAGAL